MPCRPCRKADACEFNCFPRRNGGRDARGFVSQSTTPVWVFLWSTPDRSLSHSSPPKKPRVRALGIGSVKASSRNTMAPFAFGACVSSKAMAHASQYSYRLLRSEERRVGIERKLWLGWLRGGNRVD